MIGADSESDGEDQGADGELEEVEGDESEEEPPVEEKKMVKTKKRATPRKRAKNTPHKKTPNEEVFLRVASVILLFFLPLLFIFAFFCVPLSSFDVCMVWLNLVFYCVVCNIYLERTTSLG